VVSPVRSAGWLGAGGLLMVVVALVLGIVTTILNCPNTVVFASWVHPGSHTVTLTASSQSDATFHLYYGYGYNTRAYSGGFHYSGGFRYSDAITFTGSWSHTVTVPLINAQAPFSAEIVIVSQSGGSATCGASVDGVSTVLPELQDAKRLFNLRITPIPDCRADWPG